MKKLFLSGTLLIGIILLIGCQFQIKKTPPITEITSSESIQKNNNWESFKVIPGNFGPYGNKNNTSIVAVAISNKIRAIAYTMDNKSYVVVNDKKFGPYDKAYPFSPLKVSDNFWSFITFKNDGNSIHNSSKTAYINGEAFKLDGGTGSIEITFSDSNNSWGMKYVTGGWHAIINGDNSNLDEYNKLSRMMPYQNKNDEYNYYVNYKDDDYLIGDIGDEGALFADCMAVGKNKWGCSVAKKDGRWHIFIYENGIKKEYGPYGKFSDPRELSEFKLSNNGFIFCTSNLAFINNKGVETKFQYKDIHQCNYANENFGFKHESSQIPNSLMVNVNGKDYGPYALIDNFSISSGGWGFKGYIREKNKSEYIINGEIISDINIISGPSISDENWAVAHKKDYKKYMKVEKHKK